MPDNTKVSARYEYAKYKGKFSMRLKKLHYDWLEELAENSNMSMASYVREIIEGAIERRYKKFKNPEDEKTGEDQLPLQI